jgi:hypothetical protein
VIKAPRVGPLKYQRMRTISAGLTTTLQESLVGFVRQILKPFDASKIQQRFVRDNILMKKKFPKVIKFLIFVLQVRARKPYSIYFNLVIFLDGRNFGEGNGNFLEERKENFETFFTQLFFLIVFSFESINFFD